MPVEFIVEPGNFTEFQKKLATVGATVAKIMESEMVSLGGDLARAVKIRTPQGAAGMLAASTDWQLIMVRAPETVATLLIRQAAVSRPTPEARTAPTMYRHFVAGGTRPHMPPSTALEMWVFRKLGTTIKAMPRVAFAVAKKIAVEGTEDNPYTVDAVMASMPEIERAATNMGRQIAINLLDITKLP